MILAEGLTVESYLDTGDRTNFDRERNDPTDPKFSARLAPDAALLWETRAAAPLVLAGDQLATAHAAVMNSVPTHRVSSMARQAAAD